MLDGLKGTNLLVLDSGNALFRNAGLATDADRTRAHFILDVMGRLGTRAMAVGPRDLSAGLGFLLAEAKTSKVKLLSANLKRAGTLVFEPSMIVDSAGLKVAIIGVASPGPIVANASDVLAEGTLDSVKAALGKLGRHDLTVVLSATSYADSMQLAEQLKGQVDFVIQSGEFRGSVPPQRVENSSTFIFASAQKGQALAKLTYTPGAGKTPIIELSAVDRDRQQLEFVNNQVKTLVERLQLIKDDALRVDLTNSLRDLRERQATLKKSVEAPVAAGARTLSLEWVPLGADKADDPALKAEVLKIEPTYAGTH